MTYLALRRLSVPQMITDDCFHIEEKKSKEVLSLTDAKLTGLCENKIFFKIKFAYASYMLLNARRPDTYFFVKQLKSLVKKN